MFKTSDLSLNQYHHVFFQVSPDAPNVVTTHMYDNAMNSLGTLDTSFGAHNIVELLTMFDQSGANPYVVGTDHNGSFKRNMDLGFLGVYNNVLKPKQHQTLMKYTNQNLLEPHSGATIYMITVNGGKFYVNGVQAPYLLMDTGIYVFDQRHPSNVNHPLRLSVTDDGTHNGGVEYVTNVVKNGTPGSINAYTMIKVTNADLDLFYYCGNHPGMGENFSSIDLVYYVKVVQNFLGEYVYAFSTTANGTYYNQMDLSFNAGQQYLFNVGHASNTGYRLEFGSTVDDVATINTSNVVRDGDTIVLDLNSYSGDPLVYFEDSSAGMGYVEAVLSSPSEDITSNLYTHFTFDNINGTTLYNETSNGNATLVSMTQSSSSKEGTHSISANGGARGIYGSFLPSNMYNNSFTICFWHYITQTHGLSVLLRDLNASYIVNIDNNKLTYWNGATEINFTTTLSLNTWYHISMVHNKQNNTLQFYIDGVLEYTLTSGNFRTGGPTSNFALCGTKNGNGWSDAMRGYMDDFRFYERSLTPDQLLQLVNGPGPSVTQYNVSVSGSPLVFDISGSLQPQLNFSANESYVFDQSDPTNAGYQIVFGSEPDAATNYTTGKTIMGTPGQPGAYTQLQLPEGFSGSLFYYHDTIPYMGYGPLVLSVDQTSRAYGEVVTFTVTNRTGVVETYTITGVASADINGSDLNGTIGYGQQVDLSYVITGGGSDMVFSVGGLSETVTLASLVLYTVSVSGSPSVFALSGTLQPEVNFVANQLYVFDQSDPTNAGNQIVFGTEPDAATNYTTGKTIFGTPGQPGAYTQLELPPDFSGPLFYYHDTIPYMGYGPLVLSADQTSRAYGEVVTFTVTNRTGVLETYTITGVASSDINGADLSGSIGYGQQIDLSYTVTGSDKTMVFSIGDLSANVSLANLISYQFAVQDNALGQPVFAVYDTTDAEYYNQTDLSFVAPNVYQFDLSSSVVDGGYTLVFGTEVDNTGTVVETGYVIRETGKVILDLRTYTGNALVYFEDSTTGMGYVEPQIESVVVQTELQMSDAWAVSNMQTYCSNLGVTVSFSNVTTFNSNEYKIAGSVSLYGTNTAYADFTVPHDCVSIECKYAPNWVNNTMDNVTSVYRVASNGTATLLDSISSNASSSYYSAETTRILNIPTWTVGEKIRFQEDDIGVVYIYYIRFIQSDTTTVPYTVSVSGSPSVFDISGSLQPQVNFSANESYVFDQSDPSNTGYQIVFGSEPDAATNYTTGKTIMGTPGQPGAYTQLELPEGFTGPLFYYHDTIPYMGYGPLVLSVDQTTRKYGEVVTFTITNRTGVVETYTITGVVSADINGADLTGSIGYGQQVDLSYVITGGGSDMVFSIGGLSETVTLTSLVLYTVSVSGSPSVFNLSDVLQPEVNFVANQLYVFDQSDSTNAGYQIVFGSEPDAASNYTTGKTIFGTPGQPGAYTQLELPEGFSGPLFYYHDTIPYMGYGPLVLSVDQTSRSYGEVVTFTVTNRTGVVETYTITGVVSADINGADLSGTIGYGQQVDLSYTITGSDKTMVFSVGDLSSNVSLANLISYQFAVQDNALGQPVFAVYDTTDAEYYNQADLSFVAPNVYQFDLSSSVVDGGYTLVFGTEVDNTGTVVETGYVTRETGKVILDLRTYTGDALVYFEDTNAGMGYVKATPPIGYGQINSPQESAFVTISNVATNEFAATDFTIEFYMYSTSFPTGNFSPIGDAANNSMIVFNNRYAQQPETYARYMGTHIHIAGLTTANLNNNEWNHVAMVRQSNYINLYVNGVKYSGGANTSTDSMNTNLILFENGTGADSENYFNGSMTSVRISKKAVYTNNFTVLPLPLKTTQLSDTNISSLVESDIVLLINPDPNGGNAIINESTVNTVTITAESGVTTDIIQLPLNPYIITVSGDVFDLSGILQREVVFTAGESYIFDQSDSTNAGYQIVFGSEPDAATNYITGKTIMGTPGRPGAYTQLELPEGFSGSLFYYHDTIPYMGYGPMTLSTDLSSAGYGDIVTFTITNRTGVVETYTITGIASEDISGADLTGSIGYGQQVDLSYMITGGGSDMVFSVGGLSETVTLASLTTYEFAVQDNALGQPVFAVYDTTDAAWYNQTDLSFVAPNVYQFDLSSSVVDGGYTLVFGTEVDNSGTVVEGGYVTRETGKVILDLRDYTGDALVYFEDTSAGMGYMEFVAATIEQQNYLLDVNTGSSNLTKLNSVNLPTTTSSYSFTDSLTGVSFTDVYSFDGSKYIEFEDNSLVIGSDTFIIEYYAYKTANYDYAYSSSDTYSWGQPAGAFIQNDYNQGDQSWFKIHTTTDGNFHKEFKISPLFNDTLNKWYHIKIKLENPNSTTITITVEKRNETDWSVVTTTTQTETSDGNYTLTSNYFRLGGWGTKNSGNSGSGFKGYLTDFKMYKEGDTTMVSNVIVNYTVAVSGSPGVFDLSGSLQPQIDFSANTTYIFDQSDPTNDGYQIVFGSEPDAASNYTTGKTIMGTPGRPGAYTQLELPADFSGSLFYYHDTIPYMGYGPLVLSVDQTSRAYGDVVTFTVTNRTGVVETYTITGVVSADINGADLTGSIGYGQQVDLSYTITGNDKTMVFSVGDLSENVSITNMTTYEFAVQDNALGQPVFAVYDTSDAVYYNQTDLSFSGPNMYQFDLSSSVVDGGYTLVFGTEVDNSGTVVETGYVTRETDKIILDLRTYTGDALVYFEDSSAGMGYAPYIIESTSFGIITNPGGNAVQIDNVRTDLIAGVDFTIEFFVNFSSFSTTKETVIMGTNAVDNLWYKDFLMLVYPNTGNFYIRYYWNNGNGANVVYDGPVFSTNQWHHVAFVRYNNTAYFYLDGTSMTHDRTNEANRDDMTNSTGTLDSTLYLFKFWDTNYPGITGSLASVRISKKAVYTGNFTTPSPNLAITQDAGTNIQSLVSSDVVLLVKADPLGNNNVINVSEYSATITEDAGITTTLNQEIEGSSEPSNLLYYVSVSGSPAVFDISGTLQSQLDFSANTNYIFDQSDPTNAGYQIVFGSEPDAASNYTTGKTIMGTPGQPGAYTQLELPEGFIGPLFYYHDTIPYMGYGPLVLSVDQTSRAYGEVVTFTVTNRTGVVETYAITGVVSADINGADLTGSIGYGQQVDLSYVITGNDKTMVFSVGDLSENVSITNMTTYEFAVKDNALGQPVFAVYDVSDAVYYNQTDLSFVAPNMYQFDLSSSVTDGGYTLVFGTEVDNSGTVIETGYVTRETDKIILDLRDYSGDALVYFEDSITGMGYVEIVLTETVSAEILLYRQTAPTYYTSELSTLQTQSLNENDPTNSNYSILNKLYSSTTRSNYEIRPGIYRFRLIDDNGYEIVVEQENPFDHTDTSPNPTVISNSGFVMPSGKDWDFDGWHISNDTTYSIIEGVVGAWGRWNIVHVKNSSAWDIHNPNKLIAFSSHSSNNGILFSNWIEFYVQTISNIVIDPYIVTVSGSPPVFDISGSLQPQIDFVANQSYVFDQSDPTNDGYQIVFGSEPDAATNYTTNKTIMGTPGQPGAYTQLELPEGFTGPLFYYHDTIPYMGYGPLVLSVDETSRAYGEVVTFTVTNRTGVAETYTITGVVSADINGADITGSIGYGQQVDLSYVITGGGSDMVFSVGGLSETVTLASLVLYTVSVSGSPSVFALSGTLQPEVNFVANQLYVFDQSDPTNAGNQIVFGSEPDAASNYTTGKTIFGTPGQPGAYTQLELPPDFTGPLFYYHDTIPYMGYGPLVLSVDETSRAYGEVVTFTITNRTGVVETYTITGVASADINGADLTGSIGYGQQVDLSYVITGNDRTMVLSVGDLSENVSITNMTTYEFAVQDNALGQPVFAVYNTTDAVYYNQTDLSFSAPNMYQFDLSSSVVDGGYTLVFGTEVDNSGTVVEGGYVTRETGKVILDLRDYTGDALVYFEDTNAGMGYVEFVATTPEQQNYLLDVNTGSSNLTKLNSVNLPTTTSSYSFTDSLTGVSFTDVYSFDGSKYIEFEDNSLVIGSDTFIIEYYAYKTANYDYAYSSSDTHSWGQPAGAFLQNDYSQGNQSWFKIHTTTAGTAGKEFFISPMFNDTLNKWYHIKIKLENPNSTTMTITVEKRNETDWSVVTTTTQTETSVGNYTLTSNYFRLGGWGNKNSGNSGTGFKGYLTEFKMYKEGDITMVGNVTVNYTVAVSGSPSVFDISGSLQPQIDFSANTTYIFDQSDPTNDGYQIVFGTTPDAASNYTTGKTIMGTPGQPGAYTQLELPEGFTGPLFYYHDTIPYMGYGPLVLSVDETSRAYGEVVTFTVTNRTGVAETYTITGVVSSDINGGDLTGSIGYGQQVDLSYTITGGGSDMVFSVGGLSETVTLAPLTTYEFAVQDNALGQPVFAVYDVSDAAWYNQTDLSFVAPNMYLIDLSSSVIDGSYTLVFGTEVDNAGTVVETGYVTRETDKIILDLRTYTGDALVYFEDTNAGMGYVDATGSGEEISTTNFINTSVLTNINSETYTLSGNSNSFANGNYQISSTSNMAGGQNLYDVVRKYSDGYGTEYDWHSPANTYNPSYTGSEYTTANGVDYYGEWLEITMPYKLVLKNLYIIGRSIATTARPKTVYMLGSNDGGATYELIVYISNTGTVSGTSYSSNTPITGVTAGYSTIRMVSNTLHGSNFNMVSYWELTGDVISLFTITKYDVTVNTDSSSPIFDISGTPQPEVSFTAGETYVFDQSDPTNAGYQIVFGSEPDAASNYTTGKTIMGTPGQSGAYTQLELPADFSGPLFYYHDTIPYMGYGPLVLSVDETSRAYGEVVTFTVTNRTGVAETYTITGVVSSDINGGDLTGSIGYGQQVDLSYVITGGGSDMVFSVGSLSETVTLAPLTTYEFAVQDNALGQPVFAVYDISDAAWYNQTDLSFSAPDIYLIDLSNSVVEGSYTLVFGTEVDNSSSIVETGYVTRETDKIILDLRDYSGQALVYFEDTSAGMGYIDSPSTSVTAANLIDLPTEVTASGYSMTNTSDVNNNTKSAFFIDNNSITPSIVIDSGYMVYMFWAYIHEGSTHETVNSNGVDYSILGFNYERKLSFHNGNVNYPMDNTSNTFNTYNPNTLESVPQQTWTHCAIVNEFSTGTFKAYINGVEKPVEHNQHDDNKNEFTVKLGTYSTQFKASVLVSISDLYINNSASSFAEAENIITGFLSGPNISYVVSVINGVFDISGSLQPQIDFSANQSYVFDQSDSTNDGYQIVFGSEPDAASNYTTGKTIMGTPGRPGAYTQLELPEGFTGPLFYYHDTIPYMGYGPLVLSVDETSRSYGEVVTFTVTNRTGVVETYTITGVVSSDINGADLTGSIGYGQQVDLSYTITGGGSDMVFSVGGLSETVTLAPLTTYEFAVQDNALGQPVFAVYDVSDAVYYNQTDLSFSAPNMYLIDLSSSVTDGSYTLVFGTEVDNSGTVVEGGYVTRETGKIILDLRTYIGDALVYFEDSTTGMGYNVLVEAVADNLNTIFNGVTQPTFYWDFRTTTPESDGTNSYVTDVINLNNQNLKAVAHGTSFDNLEGPDLDTDKYIQIDPFTFGSPCSIELYYKIHSTTIYGRLIDFNTTNGTSNNNDAVIIYNNSGLSVLVDNGFNTGTATSTNVWEHGVLTIDSNGNLKFYRNKNSTINSADQSITTMERTINYVGASVYNNRGYVLDGQVAFVRVWNGHVLSTTEISDLYDNREVRYELGNGSLSYTVTVSGSPPVFDISGSLQPQIDFSANTTYNFDQSDPTNAGHQLVFGETPDDTANLYTTGVTIMGTPGQEGAYTQIVVPDPAPSSLYYFSSSSSGMGFAPHVPFSRMITTATTSYVDIQGVKSQYEYTDYTMEFYFRYDGSLPTTGEDIFISSNDSNFIVLRYHSNGKLYVRGGGSEAGHNNIDFDGCTVVANTWHHIAVVRENQRLFMYFDGVKKQYTSGGNTGNHGNADGYSVTSSGSSLMRDADLMLFSYANSSAYRTQFNYIGSLSNVRLSAKAVYHHTNSDYDQPKSFTVPSLPLSTSQSAGTNIASLQSSDVWLLVNADPDNADQVKNTSQYAVTSITNTGTITTETGITPSPF